MQPLTSSRTRWDEQGNREVNDVPPTKPQTKGSCFSTEAPSKPGTGTSSDTYTHFFGYDCAPNLALLSDSEESSYASCGTEEFFDFEDISSALTMIDHWQKLAPHRRVRFNTANVREYAITVGDHPVCLDGLALSLDWIHSDEQVYDIDDYESRRRKCKGRRRRTMKLDYWQRREILQSVGSFTNIELSRIQCLRNQAAVSEFLVDAGMDADFGPSEGEQGVELLELEQEKEYYDANYAYDLAGESEWQMKVQILEE
jgi:hypothetical protein